MISNEAARARLETWRADITEMDAVSADSRRPVTLDQQAVGRLSRMDAMQQQAMSNAEAARRAQDLRRIDAALARIEAGEYGSCVKCGNDIAEQRLRLDPAVATCIGCAA